MNCKLFIVNFLDFRNQTKYGVEFVSNGTETTNSTLLDAITANDTKRAVISNVDSGKSPVKDAYYDKVDSSIIATPSANSLDREEDESFKNNDEKTTNAVQIIAFAVGTELSEETTPSEPKTESTSELETKPTTKQTTESTSESKTETITKPTTESTSESKTESTAPKPVNNINTKTSSLFSNGFALYIVITFTCFILFWATYGCVYFYMNRAKAYVINSEHSVTYKRRA